MSILKHYIHSFIRDESGLSSVEYIVAGTLIIVVLVAGLTTFGTTVDGTLTFFSGAVE